MKVYKIAVTPGDEVEPEVLEEGIKILKKTTYLDGGFSFEFTHFPWGCEYYLKYEKMMSGNGVEILKDFDAIYLNAVGAPGVPDYISLWELLLDIRESFDQYINLRSMVLLRGAPYPLKDVKCEGINMIFVREDGEGEYADSGSWLCKGRTNEVMIQNSVFSRTGCKRVIRYAYNLAREKGKILTSISRGDALDYSMILWDQIFKEVGLEYPDTRTYLYLADTVSMFMVKDPKCFEVVVTSNLFRDMLIDLGAAIAGGLGSVAGANLNLEHKSPSMFEPIHGFTPDIAGHNIVDPLAAIWSANWMLKFFGYNRWVQRILDAVETIMWEGRRLIPDMGRNSTTSQAGDEVAAAPER